MATFTYEAVDKQGSTVSGLIEAGSERGAAADLREQGLFPMRLALSRGSAAPLTAPTLRATPASSQDFGASTATYAPPSTSTSTAASFDAFDPRAAATVAPGRIDAAPFLVSVPLTELAMMYRQMSTLMNAGVPMVQMLTTLAQQTRNGRLKNILAEGATQTAGGYPLTKVMGQYPAVFSQFQLEMIRAGETSGAMEVMCTRIADYLERETEIRRKLKTETLYPKIVLFVAGCVLVLFAFLKAGAAGALGKVEIAGAVGGGGFALWWLARYLNQYPQIGAAWDEVKMMIPGVGTVSRKYATARFCRALGTLYSAGVLLPTAVGIAARACGNRAIGVKLQSCVGALMSGNGLSGMLAQSGLLSPIAIQMARTGEQTGSIDTMMDKVADYLEGEADLQAHQLAKFLGVFVLLLAAVIVAIIVISFYTGMLSETMRAGDAG